MKQESREQRLLTSCFFLLSPPGALFPTRVLPSLKFYSPLLFWLLDSCTSSTWHLLLTSGLLGWYVSVTLSLSSLLFRSFLHLSFPLASPSLFTSTLLFSLSLFSSHSIWSCWSHALLSPTLILSSPLLLLGRCSPPWYCCLLVHYLRH